METKEKAHITPGPWHTENSFTDNKHVMVYAEDSDGHGNPICEVSAKGQMEQVYGSDNARAIAALPDLLKPAQEYVHRCPMCNAGDECQDDLCYSFRAALEKAGVL